MRNRALYVIAFLSLGFPLGAHAFDPELDDDSAAAPAPMERHPAASKPVPYEESGPRDLKSYLDAGKTPAYIRIDVKGYNIRKTPDFAVNRTGNVDFKSRGGDLFVVEAVKKMAYGAAVQIHVDDELRWVYVPYQRKNDFQFCESEACFSAMARTLDYLLKGSNVSVDQAQTCGITSGPEGLVLPAGAAAPSREPDPVPLPPRRPVVSTPKPQAPPAAPAGPTKLSGKPGWESRTPWGPRYTAATIAALDKYGKGLTATKQLGDAAAFCPNYSRLSDSQRKEFWVHLFAGIALAESSDQQVYPPFDEHSHGNVSTRSQMSPYGFQHFSMGLFALSYNYADMRPYQPACSGISRRADQGKGVVDTSLSIYDLKNQTECAVGIMNYYVTRHGAIGYNGTASRGSAWSTVMSYNPSTRTRTIPEIRRSFPVCFGAAR